MTDLESMIWLVATALMIVTLLTVGTLAAADLLPRRRRPHDEATVSPVEAGRLHDLPRSAASTPSTAATSTPTPRRRELNTPAR